MFEERIEKILYKVQKPGRYIGGEKNQAMKNKEDVDIRFAFCYPDLYEVGMSNLGLKILYELINSRKDAWCERCFAPPEDMETQLRENNIPLFALESKDPLTAFDILGFTLQFELNYTNILLMLDLAGIPYYAKDRDDSYPLIIAGGPCAVNSEPVAPFFDLIAIGDGEESMMQILDLYKECKAKGISKKEFLKLASKINSVYVPSLYEIEYDGAKIKSISPEKKVDRYIISDFENCFIPERPIVPTIQAIHDRIAIELFRGCIRGCRFCQAGMIYRPARFRSEKLLKENAVTQCGCTGYDEISLLSLSSSDYPDIEKLFDSFSEYTKPRHIGLSLPSLRIDNMPQGLLEKIGGIRKSGLTFAPEAGSQRLRDAINKNITESDILNTCKRAFEQGYTAVKMYFMMGLPTETDEDIIAIAQLAQKIVDLYYHLETRRKGKGVEISISLATFVPKPFTPFQWEAQINGEEIARRQKLLKESLTTKKVSLKWHDPNVSRLEAIMARGDRRLAPAIVAAYENGCRFDSWDESFKPEIWDKCFEDLDIDADSYAYRKRELDEILPWDMINAGVSKKFLQRENQKAYKSETTPDCMGNCSACGITKLTGVKCFE